MQDKIKNKINYLTRWLVFGMMILPAVLPFPNMLTVESMTNFGNTKAATQSLSDKTWSNIPKSAVNVKAIQSYTDLGMTVKGPKIPAKTHLKIIGISPTVLSLADGSFVANTQTDIISDVVTSMKDTNQTVYLISDTEILKKPFTTFDNESYKKTTKGDRFKASKIAITNWGTYYGVSLDDGKEGWISADQVTTKNPKLDAVQIMLNQKYNRDNLSIYVKDLDSGFTSGVNSSKMMYSASLSKLPILYWTQKKIIEGKISLSDQLTYNVLVNSFTGAFQTEGTGFLPKTADNQSYSLLDLINRTAKNSDNVASNMLAYYETNQFSNDFQSEITTISGQSWNPVEREASSEMVGRVLEALYHEGGASFDALVGTDFDAQRIPANLPKTVKVAHKIGTADEFNHDAAVIFTDTPYILVIETSNSTGNDVLADISKDVYEVMK